LKRDLSKQWAGIEPNNSLIVNSGNSKVAIPSFSLVKESGEEDLVEEDGEEVRWITFPGGLDTKPARSEVGRAVVAILLLS
jgi:hypothetical protein